MSLLLDFLLEGLQYACPVNTHALEISFDGIMLKDNSSEIML